MSWFKSIGLKAARQILFLSGNAEHAVTLEARSAVQWLPAMIKVEGTECHVLYASGPSQWADWDRQMRRAGCLPDLRHAGIKSCGSHPHARTAA